MCDSTGQLWLWEWFSHNLEVHVLLADAGIPLPHSCDIHKSLIWFIIFDVNHYVEHFKQVDDSSWYNT
jgi:hypothetical protein